MYDNFGKHKKNDNKICVINLVIVPNIDLHFIYFKNKKEFHLMSQSNVIY